ncbi:hypothetical protein G6F57_022808 [Rhizopus arrhizus]|nr:hypothetical protein G6F57_022808 [Rhizopus arrhizus]
MSGTSISSSDNVSLVTDVDVVDATTWSEMTESVLIIPERFIIFWHNPSDTGIGGSSVAMNLICTEGVEESGLTNLRGDINFG